MTEKTPQELLEEFYSKPLYLSYSALNKLIYAPVLYYNHYVLKQKEDKLDSYLIDGKLIHCLLLDNGSFDQQFILMPDTLPTDSARTVIDKVYILHREKCKIYLDFTTSELTVYTEEILNILKEINLHQSLKTDQQRLDKIITEQAKSYFEFLKIKKDKTLVDSETMKRCNDSVTVLKTNPKVSNLLGLFVSEMDNVDIKNEQEFKAELDKSFGLKGIIDSLKLDHDSKIIYINDLKTTGKSLIDFPETVEFYNYWAQAAIYQRLVWYNFNDLIFNQGYKVLFNFIVVDKYLQVYPFAVSDDTMSKWQLKLENLFNEANWHYSNKNYNLPFKFATGNVIL